MNPVASQQPGATSNAPEQKFYCGRLLGEHADALSALISHGFSPEHAQGFITEALVINRSDAIVIADENKTTMLMVSPEPSGTRWRSIEAVPEYFDTEAEALAFAQELAEALLPQTFTWVIASTVSAPSMRGKQ